MNTLIVGLSDVDQPYILISTLTCITEKNRQEDETMGGTNEYNAKVHSEVEYLENL